MIHIPCSVLIFENNYYVKVYYNMCTFCLFLLIYKIVFQIGCVHSSLKGNGQCDKDANIEACNFDGGECCPNENDKDFSSCSDSGCECIISNVFDIKSPGFTSPGFYANNLDVKWLIKVPTGRTIQLKFESFQVESQSSCV